MGPPFFLRPSRDVRRRVVLAWPPNQRKLLCKTQNSGPVLYWGFGMTRRTTTVWLFVLLALGGARAAQREYLSGTILDIRQQERDRVLLYIVNTPIMTEDPYFTIALDVNGMRYEGEFLPRSQHEMLPSFWKADETVQLRLDKHFMYLKREDGSEVKFLILSKSAIHSAQNSH